MRLIAQLGRNHIFGWQGDIGDVDLEELPGPEAAEGRGAGALKEQIRAPETRADLDVGRDDRDERASFW